MALVVKAVNISELAAVSDYDVQVRINNHVIARGIVRGHERKGGWRVLLRRISEEARDAK